MSILSVEQLKVYYPLFGGVFKRKVGEVKAVDGLSFDLKPGQTLGLVGESGCGKSTLGKALVRLLKPDAGSIKFDGQEIASLSQQKMRPLRKDIQMVFQDPAESLDSRMTVRELIEEPLIIHKQGNAKARQKRVLEILDQVGLPKTAAQKYGFEFSGGQRQRIGIARALVLNPKLIVLDEPVSALDVSVQAQVLNLLTDLQKEFDLSYLFISHDLSVVRHISDEVAVMYLGKIVEKAETTALFKNPLHAYTKVLLDAIPVADPSIRKERTLLEGDVPTPINPPEGSAFGFRIQHPEYESTTGMDLSPVEIRPNHFVAPDPCCVDKGLLAKREKK